MPQIEGSVLGDFPKMMRQMTENVFQNMRTRFPTGVPTPPQGDSDTVTIEMLEEAMREEFFADDLSSQEGIYKELVSASNIRLLTFCSTDKNNRLCFSLDEVDLQDHPEFVALSYVWNDPRAPLYQQSPLPHHRKHEIICNGETVSVSGNLFNALHTIFLGWDEDKSPLSGIESGRIWIDQLCINQQDVAEKSQQVAFMDTLYQKAKRVVAWIGPDDSHTLRAISLMKRIGCIPRNTYIDPSYDVAARLREFSETDLTSLMSFFASAYFQRVWIVQEVVFAKENRMLCGRHTVSYKDLVTTSSWLFHTGAWSLLTVHAASFQTPTSIGKQAAGKAQQRVMPMGLRIQHHIRTHVNKGTSKSEPAKILLMARELQATDLRDKFYAMMGLAKQAATRLEIDINLPKPDYSKSLEAVTFQFLSAYIHQRRKADILLFVEDASYRKLHSLPSWVPDFSTPQLPRKFSDHLSRKWNAGGKRAYTKIQSDGSLIVEARHIGVVNGVATPFSVIQEKKDWSTMFKLTESLFNKNPASNMQPDEQLVRVLTCQPRIPLEDRIRREFSDWLVQNLHFLTQAPLDPVPSNAAILSIIQNVDELLSLETSEAYKVNFEKFADMRAALYAKGREGKATGNQGEAEVNKEPPSDLIDNTQARIESLWKKNPRGAFPDPGYVREALLSLYSTKDDARPRQVEIESNARKFRAAVGANIDSRVLFTTDDGYLGLGSQSTRVGDEVWVISGVKVPIVLRKRESTVDWLYTVVGQCFVSHAMLGEVVDNEQGPPSLKIRMM
ncbi:heterokaryon incompatibility protein-domain-containing protein [Phaeosphaeriaceae sp. PMI808]|nr:heterokaryon incompatibility protein-domain-containing protein [Phaeosphaeriaceae sp. PMI808]